MDSPSFFEFIKSFVEEATDKQVAAFINKMASFLLREMGDKFDSAEYEFLYKIVNATSDFLSTRQEGE